MFSEWFQNGFEMVCCGMVPTEAMGGAARPLLLFNMVSEWSQNGFDMVCCGMVPTEARGAARPVRLFPNIHGRNVFTIVLRHGLQMVSEWAQHGFEPICCGMVPTEAGGGSTTMTSISTYGFKMVLIRF
jgi:hypothetical protein